MSITGAIGGIADAISRVATDVAVPTLTALNQFGVIGRQPTQTVVLPGGAVTGGQRYGPAGVPMHGTPAAWTDLDIPGFDFAPQGTNEALAQAGGSGASAVAAVAALTSPFYMRSNGTVVAQPHVKARPNGKIEWFIPAGKPKSWTKASKKTTRRCRPR